MVLVTGANGFVGSYMCRYLLSKGVPVRGLRRANSDLKLVADIKDKISWVDGDVLDVMALEDAMDGVEKIYHTAAIISYVPKERNRMMKINVEGTANVVNVALYKQVKKMLHISSIAALGRTGNDTTITEQSGMERNNISSDYSISKFLAEREVWRGGAEGLNTVIINPSVILGSGDWQRGSCKLFTTIYKGFKFYTEGRTGYVDVRDVVKSAYQLMDSDISSERFIVNAENKLYKDLLFSIADGLKVKCPSIKAGTFLSGVAWRLEAVKALLSNGEPTVTKATAKIANARFNFDNSKIKNALAYEFIPIEKTVRETAALFLQEKQSGNYKPLTF